MPVVMHGQQIENESIGKTNPGNYREEQYTNNPNKSPTPNPASPMADASSSGGGGARGVKGFRARRWRAGGRRRGGLSDRSRTPTQPNRCGLVPPPVVATPLRFSPMKAYFKKALSEQALRLGAYTGSAYASPFLFNEGVFPEGASKQAGG